MDQIEIIKSVTTENHSSIFGNKSGYNGWENLVSTHYENYIVLSILLMLCCCTDSNDDKNKTLLYNTRSVQDPVTMLPWLKAKVEEAPGSAYPYLPEVEYQGKPYYLKITAALSPMPSLRYMTMMGLYQHVDFKIENITVIWKPSDFSCIVD